VNEPTHRDRAVDDFRSAVLNRQADEESQQLRERLRLVLVALNNEIRGFGSQRGVLLALFKWLAENGIYAEGEPRQYAPSEPTTGGTSR
jgi:hypothetical protein